MSKLPPVLANLPLPIIGSPLFIISNPKLVIAQCKAGVVGSMPALNARPAAQLEEWLIEITEELAAYNKANPDKPAAPFAINQIVHKSNDRLEHDMEMVVKYKVPIVITSLGARTDVNDAVHSYGGVTLHDVINNKFAQKAIEKGADGIVAVAAGAGGHAGIKSPFALIQEIRQWFDGPIALSGSIATGGAVLAAQAMGADFAYIGTAFIATEEARASDAYKQAIVEGTSGRHRLLEPVHRRARQLPRAQHRQRRHGPGEPARRRREDHELLGRRGQQGQGLEGHLGLGPGHRRDQRSLERRRLHREAQARIPGGSPAARALRTRS
jgi:nitronate monooxygenase